MRRGSMARSGIAGIASTALLLLSSGCVDAVVNSSPWLRWKIFAAFGADRLCSEMVKRGAPLRLADSAPIAGRFYAGSCQSTLDDDRQTMTVRFAGDGYAFTPVTRRMGFSSSATVEYKPDFHKDGGTVYVWFKPVQVGTPSFNIGFVEQPVASLAAAVTPVGFFANLIGQQIVGSELSRGFTVIHESAGDDFSLGILNPPARPAHPYQTHGGDRTMLANETSELHAGELDFLGPFEVDSNGRALYVTITPTSASLDVAIMGREAGDAWRRRYQSMTGVPLPPAPPLVTGVLPMGVETSRSFPLAPGQYYIVLDNSPFIGQVAPPPGGLFENVVRVSYRVALGDAS